MIHRGTRGPIRGTLGNLAGLLEQAIVLASLPTETEAGTELELKAEAEAGYLCGAE